MIIQIKNKNLFVNNFLSALNKINNIACIQISQQGFSSILYSQETNVTLYSVLNYTNDWGDLKINLPDVTRFIKLLNCIEDESVELKIESNNIKYSSPSIRFTYHLLHEGIIPHCTIKPEKIKLLTYDTTFSISQPKLVNIVKGSSITPTNTKIYFSTEDEKVFCDLTDKQKHNTDSYKIQISDKFNGLSIDSLPLNYEVIKYITMTRCNGVDVLINKANSVVTFDVTTENVKNIYISSGLIG